YRWGKSDRITNNLVDIQFQFNGFQSGYSYSDFLLGLPSRARQGSLRLNAIRNRATNFYINDDWKVRQNVTLTLGLRWEPYYNFWSRDDELNVYGPGEQSQLFPNAPSGLLYAGDPGVPRGGAPVDWNNLAPRIGLAWQPFGHSKTSIRAAYGLFYDLPPFHEQSQFVRNPPFSFQVNPASGELRSLGATFSDPYKGRVNQFPFETPKTDAERSNFQFSPPFLLRGVARDNVAGYNHQWNFNIQQELMRDFVVTAAYVGSKGSKLPWVVNVNSAIPKSQASGSTQQRRPDQNFQVIDLWSPLGYSSYHAFQFTVNKRFSKGYTILAHYTYGKSIDVADVEGTEPQDHRNLDAEKALAQYDVPHRFVTSFLWELPSPITSGVARHILHGWQANGILTLQSGRPVNIRSGRDIAGTGAGTQRPNLVG
ncbi:MAG: hypothetical protein GY953_37565, partial [bacterium]|nr:hypothetical protein [bacterium]